MIIYHLLIINFECKKQNMYTECIIEHIRNTENIYERDMYIYIEIYIYIQGYTHIFCCLNYLFR